MTAPVTSPNLPYRSVSQLNQYERCPYSYYLARIAKVWQRPAAWLAQGSAVHEAAEAWERSGRTMTLEEAQDVYREAYARHANAYAEITPNFQFWSRSGPYAGMRDLERRWSIGLDQVEKYIRWYESHPQQVIWIAPDGTPGIELGFDINLGGVGLRGFIDAVIEDAETGEITVRDNKTGKSPGDDFQLGVYGVALVVQFGLEPPQRGDYWMGQSGKPTYPYDIGAWTVDRVTAAFHELEENIQAERFEPRPETNKCMFCDVSASCSFAVA